MSLATRCSACGTIFRVVEDQLRVSDGWVRCGRCAEVFDARAQLFDIDHEAPPPWPAQADAVQAQAGQPLESALYQAEQDEWAHQTDNAAPPSPAPPYRPQEQADLAVQHSPLEAAAPATQAFEADHDDLARGEPELTPDAGHAHGSAKDSRFDVRLEPHWSDETPASTAPAPAATMPEKPIAPAAIDMGDKPDVLMDERLTKISAHANDTAGQSPAPATASAPAGDAALPEFLRGQSDQAKWQRPAARVAMTALTLVLLSLLTLQIGLHFRDGLAALQPGLRPALEAACAITGCEVKAWQRIERIGLESSALNQAGSGNHYQLAVGLRNKADTDIAIPWVDVSLTDAAGALVAKRSLSPSDFKIDRPAMAAGSDLNLQATLSTGDSRVAGYSVEIFYP